MTTQTEFLQTHAPDGVLTPQQAAQLLELAVGDTGTQLPDNGSVPGAAPAGDQVPIVQAAPAAQVPVPVPGAANPVLMAKDGVHTIDYQKLVDAREGERQAKLQAEALTAELEALKAAALVRAEAGQAPTKTDNAVATAAAAIEKGVDPAIFGDYSEEALAKGIQALQAASTATLREQLKAELLTEMKAEMAPYLQQQQKTAKETHMDAIYAKHPDADSIHESQELKNWIATQPSYARAGYESVLAKGSTDEIIEFFDNFKAATGKTQANGNATADPKAATKTALANMQAAIPASLSDIPGGTAGPANRHELMSKLSPIDQAMALSEMSPDARDAFLNRRM